MKDYLNSLKTALSVLSPSEKIKYWSSTAGRSVIGLLDLTAILGIGLLVSIFATSASDSSPKILDLQSPFNEGNYQFLLLLVLGLFLTKAIFATYLIRTSGLRLAHAEARAARRISESYLTLSSSSQIQMGRNELLFATQIGCQALFSGMLASTSTFISEGALFIFLLIAFLIIDPFATLGLVVFFALMATTIQIVIARKSAQASEMNAYHSVEVIKLLNDSLDAQKELLVLGRLQGYLHRIETARKIAAENYSRQLYLTGMPRYIVETGLIIGVAVFAQIKLGGSNFQSGLPTLAIFLTGGLRIMAAMLPWQTSIVNIRQQLPQAKQAIELLKIPLGEACKDSTEFTNDWKIKISNLSYSYPGTSKKTVQSVNLEFKFGERIAIVGNSGAGKSTLINIILGLYDPTQGIVTINGKSPKELTKLDPGQLSYVPQSPKLVSGTLLENIALGIHSETLDINKVQESIKKADLEQVISLLPNGLNTVLDSEVSGLSGGEVQRIGLARALYSNPKILILDEPTASVDAGSSERIIKALDSISKSCTVVLITHNLESVSHFDSFVTVESGFVDTFTIFADAKAQLSKQESNPE